MCRVKEVLEDELEEELEEEPSPWPATAVKIVLNPFTIGFSRA